MLRRLVRAARRVPQAREDLRLVLAHPDCKPRRQLAREGFALGRYGMTPQFYLKRLLYQRAAGDPADYLSLAEEHALWDAKRRPDGYLRVFNDKTLFDEHLRRGDGSGPVSLPAYLGQTRASILLRPGRDDVRLSDHAAFADALTDMVERSPTGRAFAKPADDNQGTGAMLVRSAPSEQKVKEVRAAALEVDYIFQEALDQHPEMDRLHPGCLNTLRIVTGMAADGSFPVLGAVLRVGQGEGPVDNAHAGGLFVGVDRETGKLHSLAHSYFAFGGATYASHPETGVVFGEFDVPHFSEAVELARKAHERLPLLYVGWDVGITPNGPVLIEGNSGAQLLLMEIAAGGFKADLVMRSFMTENKIISH